MPTYAILGLLLVTVVVLIGGLHAHSVGGTIGEGDKKCREVVSVIQATCREANQKLLDAESDHDHDEVCEQFVKVLFCAADSVPNCFEDVLGIFTLYRHSPYNCDLTNEQISRLQKVAYGDKTNSETTPDYVPQPWTHGQDGGAKQEGGEDSDDGYEIKTGTAGGKSTRTQKVDTEGTPEEHTDSEHHKDDDKTDEHEVGSEGTREKHKASDNDGDGARHLASWSIWVLLILAVTSGRLPWRLTS